MLEQQLIEMMPELKDVDAWHSVGQRRSPNELGRAAERVIPDSVFLRSARVMQTLLTSDADNWPLDPTPRHKAGAAATDRLGNVQL